MSEIPFSRMIAHMKIIDGKAYAEAIKKDVAERVSQLEVQPKLAVLLLGDDPASHLYVSMKEKAAAELGILTEIRRAPSATPDDMLIGLIKTWNEDPSIHGILIQLPLPEGHDTDKLISTISTDKDVDGFHPDSVGRLLNNEAQIISPVHEGILRLIAKTGITINRAKVALIANSDIFSEPLEFILRKAGAIVTRMSADHLDKEACREADVIVIAVGRPHFLTRDLIKNSVVIIDVGTNREADGKLVGDVDTQHIQDLEGWLSPVPGGVGPMTIALLLKNVAELASQPSPHSTPISLSSDE